jgi:hypothetical protein
MLNKKDIQTVIDGLMLLLDKTLEENNNDIEKIENEINEIILKIKSLEI